MLNTVHIFNSGLNSTQNPAADIVSCKIATCKHIEDLC